MKREFLATLARRAIAFDVETHLIQSGLLAPPLVLGSTAWVEEGEIRTAIHGKEETLAEFIRILSDPELVMVGANIAFDLLVCAVEWARRGRDVMPLIFQALEEGRIYDVFIGEALGAIADGIRGKDWRTGSDMRDPITGLTSKYYSLAIVTDLRLGRKDAKVNDEWREKYYLLDGVPIDELPPAARQYPQDDVRNTLECCLAQVGAEYSCRRHRWEDDGTVCSGCGATPENAGDGTCWRVDPARNLHSMRDQVETAFALHLGAAWGFSVDQEAVTAEMTRVEKIRAAVAPKLIELGYLKWKKDKGQLKLSESRRKIARAVALAYGAKGDCPYCQGIGKVPDPKKAPKRIAYDPEKHGAACDECQGTGVQLETAAALRYTEPSATHPRGQIQADADVLNEAADDDLRRLYDYKADQKVVTSYGPALRSAGNHPWTLFPNVMLETDRVSYAGVVQLFPRDGALRACVRSRPGYVFCSTDYNQGEVITHAQSCLWIIGESKQADMILAGKEVHSVFGAKIANVSYDDFFKNKKKAPFVGIRQACKPIVFGKPGGMGVVKIVHNQRSSGPDTPCPGGPVMVDDGDGNLVEGFRGLRFCVLMRSAYCGKRMVTEWGRGRGRKEIPPTCLACLECVEELNHSYKELFPESVPYFDYATMVVDEGQPLSDEQCAVHGLPPGSQLAPGEMMMHVSNIIRGGVGFCDCANGFFQAMLAHGAKKAMRLAQRECVDSSMKVPADRCPGGKISKFAGQRSPLLGSRCVAFLHDEILAEMPESRASDAANRLSEIMIRALQETCPDLASIIKAPPALARRWYKQMEPVFVDDKLVPWEPK